MLGRNIFVLEIGSFFEGSAVCGEDLLRNVALEVCDGKQQGSRKGSKRVNTVIAKSSFRIWRFLTDVETGLRTASGCDHFIRLIVSVKEA